MIDLLKKFQRVVEKGNVTQAARELYITQPALSQSLQQLEKDLGGKLLFRSRNGVKPTKLGRVVYKQSKEITREEKNLHIIIQEELRKSSKTISMGMIDNVGLIFISKTYKSLLESHPQLKLQIEVNNTSVLISLVENDIVDFAIITRPSIQLAETIVIEKFANEEMVLVGKPNLISQISTPKDLEKMKFISYNKNSNTFKNIEKAFNNCNVNISYLAYSSSPGFILQMVKQGSGIAVLPRNVVSDELETKQLIEYRNKQLIFFRELSLIRQKNVYFSDTTKQFIEQLRSAYI